MKSVSRWQLNFLLNHRGVGVAAFVLFVAVSVCAVPFLGREFMPELEEGNLYVRGTFPVNVSLEEAADKARRARQIIRQYDEVELFKLAVGGFSEGVGA